MMASAGRELELGAAATPGRAAPRGCGRRCGCRGSRGPAGSSVVMARSGLTGEGTPSGRSSRPTNFTENARRHCGTPRRRALAVGKRSSPPQYGQCSGLEWRAHRRSASSSARPTQAANGSPSSRSSRYAVTTALDVVGELRAGDLVGPELAAEAGVEPETAAEVHLEALDLVAVVVEDELALEADVGDLDARARVGAAVDVDRDRGVELGDALLELGDELARRGPWCRRSPACRTRCRCRPSSTDATGSAGRTDRVARAGEQRRRRGRARRRARRASGTASCGRGSTRAPRQGRRARSASFRRPDRRSATRRRRSVRRPGRARRRGRR